MGGDTDANFLHYAIHKLHWSPSQINEWLDSEAPVKVFYLGSLELKIEHDRKEEQEMKRKAKKK